MCCAVRANESNGKASFVSEEDRAIEAAQAGDIAAMKTFLDRGGYIELRDSRIGMVIFVLGTLFDCMHTPMHTLL